MKSRFIFRFVYVNKPFYCPADGRDVSDKSFRSHWHECDLGLIQTVDLIKLIPPEIQARFAPTPFRGPS